MRRGGNVYAETPFYNYAPVWAFVLYGIDHVAQWVGVPFTFAVRALLALVDVACAACVATIAGRLQGRPLVAFLAYLLNPVAVLLGGLHGQFENLAALHLLMATCILLRRPERPSTRWWVWVLGTATLLIKHLLVFSVWMLFVTSAGWRRGLLLSVGAGIVFASTFLPYLPDGAEGVARNVIGYRSASGFYGLSLLLSGPAALFLFVAAMGVLPWLADRLALVAPARLELAAVSLLVLIPGFGGQYLLVPILFGSVRPSRWFVLYSVVAGWATARGFGLLGGPPWVILLLATWATAVAWLLSYVIRRARADADATLRTRGPRLAPVIQEVDPCPT
jgi:hypothetical protein